MANCIEYLTDEGRINSMSETAILDFIIEAYQGTCNFLSCDDTQWLEDNDKLSELDNVIFECEVCNWWCEAGDEEEHPDVDRACSDCCE